jgi:hypothetical protein
MEACMSKFKKFLISSLALTVVLTVFIVIRTPNMAQSQDNNLEACKNLYLGQSFGNYDGYEHVINGISNDGYVTYALHYVVNDRTQDSDIQFFETTCSIVYRQVQRSRKFYYQFYDERTAMNHGEYLRD